LTEGSIVLGVLHGLLTGLLAVGLVLVYRSDRFLNLAHGQLGALPAVFLAKLVVDEGWGYWPAVLVCVVLGVGTGVVVERYLVAKMRKRTSSSTTFLLLTLGVTQLLAALLYIKALTPNPVRLLDKGYPLPLHVHWRIGGVVLGGQDAAVLILCPLVVVALAVFLRYSLLGKMIRATASNRDSARLCGISPTLVSSVTWGLAGLLSTITAVLVAPSQFGQFDSTALGPDQLFLALGAAAFGAFVSIPMTLVGGLLIGIANQLTLGATSNGGTARVVVFAMILVVIFVRGRAIASVFSVHGAVLNDHPPLRIPVAIRDRFVVRNYRGLLVAASLLVGVLLPFISVFHSEGHRFELTVIVLYAIVAISITMLMGWAGQLSLGHFAVVGVGAFVAARLAHHGWSIVALLFVCGAVGAAVMLVVGLPALRVGGLTLAVTTLGFAVVASEWLFHVSWFTSSPGTILDLQPMPLLRGLGRPGTQLAIYLMALALLVLVAVAVRGLRNSTPGRLIIAVRDDERAAAAHGVTPATVKLMALAVSGFIAGMVGVLWADAWLVASPDHFTPELSLSLLAIPVVGGLGSIGGAIAGAVVLYLPTYFISPHVTGLFGKLGGGVAFQLAFAGLSMVGVLMTYPNGIAGMARQGWEAFLKRLDAEQHRPDKLPSDRPVLDVVDVHVRFGGVHALRGASIKVFEGEIVGLIGPNGAGKSTLVNTISGVTRPGSGSVTLLSTDVSALAPELRSALGMSRSFQAAYLFPGLTVRETLEAIIGSRLGIGVLSSMARAPWARRAEQSCQQEAASLIGRMGLAEYADTLTGELSTGTRRICDLALQLATRPQVLLLDEPTAGVAQRETEAFGPLLRRIRDELDCAIVIVEHDMPLLMGLCDRVYAMVEGQVIAEGTPEEVRADPSVIASYLGTDEVAITRSGRAEADGQSPRRKVRVPAEAAKPNSRARSAGAAPVTGKMSTAKARVPRTRNGTPPSGRGRTPGPTAGEGGAGRRITDSTELGQGDISADSDRSEGIEQ
jgi:ABC-type branched-subunit amino acid transport system ATPase component/ABC-type branched-subunit amino acid transport system permease subunit